MSHLVCEVRHAGRGLDARLVVEPGEVVTLVGPNGAGKSSLLAAITGLLTPDVGVVRLGNDVWFGDGRHRDPQHRRVGWLAQQPRLFPHRSVLDNVAFGPRAHGAGGREARRVAHGWLERVGVAALAGRRPATLSGGQAQRVALARALAGDPQVLALDEPFAALDVEVAADLRQVVRSVLGGRPTVLVTHDLLDVLALATRVAVLEEGRIREDGPVGQVVARPTSAFGARLADLNFVTGVTDAQGRIVGDTLTVTGPEPLPPGVQASAVFPPAAVSVFLEPPGGSPRNVWRDTVERLEERAGHVRLRTSGGLAAAITPQAALDLRVDAGATVYLSVKSQEVNVVVREGPSSG